MARITAADAAKFDVVAHKEISSSVEDNAALIEDVINSIVSGYTSSLDALVKEIHGALERSNDLTDAEIDIFTLKLPIEQYYVAPRIETIGLKEDVANMIRQRLYIQARQDATGTVEDKNNAADKAVVQETLTTVAYKRSKNQMKAKLDASMELLSALKKVTSRRMEEYRITNMSKEMSF